MFYIKLGFDGIFFLLLISDHRADQLLLPISYSEYPSPHPQSVESKCYVLWNPVSLTASLIGFFFQICEMFKEHFTIAALQWVCGQAGISWVINWLSIHRITWVLFRVLLPLSFTANRHPTPQISYCMVKLIKEDAILQIARLKLYSSQWAPWIFQKWTGRQWSYYNTELLFSL